MGAPSKAQVESFTDQIAATLAANLAGYADELSGKTVNPLWDLVDASGDPDVETALMASALAVDRQSLPENYYSAFPQLLARTQPRAFVTALAALALDAGHDNLRDYLETVSATVHPLFGELADSVLGANWRPDSDGDINVVFAPNYGSRAPDRVYVGADGSLSEETTDAGDAGTADVTLFGSDNDCLYIGSRYQFRRLVVGLSTLASATITPSIQYWNGNAWTDVSGLNDYSTGFTKNDLIQFTLPSDWVPHNKDGGSNAFAVKERLYWLRIQRTANALVTPPVGTSIRIIPEVVPTSDGGSSHLGVDQPPLALVRITAADTISILAVASADHARFVEPGTIKLRALTPINQDVTFTFSYVDQDGNNASQAQSAWSLIDALDEHSVTLAGGDTGVRSVNTDGTATTNATEGVFEIIAVESRTPAL